MLSYEVRAIKMFFLGCGRGRSQALSQNVFLFGEGNENGFGGAKMG